MNRKAWWRFAAIMGVSMALSALLSTFGIHGLGVHFLNGVGVAWAFFPWLDAAMDER